MIKPKCAFISEAILNLNPNAEFIARNEYDQITWLNDTQVIPRDLIEAEVNRLESIIDYRQLRSEEYPSIGDQLDALFKAGAFPDEMAAQIQAIKDKYPKGTV